MTRFIQIDHWLQQFVAQYQNPLFDMLAIFCNWFGSDVRVYSVFLLLFFIPKRTRRFAILALISVILATLIVAYMKIVFARPRPFVTQGLTPLIHVDASEHFVSFPSGHTVAIASIVGAYYFYFKRYFLLGVGCILVMAWSRMYLNMHYPFDTFVGGAIGIMIAWSIVALNTYYQNRQLKIKTGV